MSDIKIKDCKTIKKFGYVPKLGETLIYVDSLGEYYFIDFNTKKRISIKILDYEM